MVVKTVLQKTMMTITTMLSTVSMLVQQELFFGPLFKRPPTTMKMAAKMMTQKTPTMITMELQIYTLMYVKQGY